MFPRFAFEAPVVITGLQGQRFAGRSCDISVGGIGLNMDRDTVVALAQGGSVLTPGDLLEIAVATGTSDSEADDVQGAAFSCRVRHVRRLSLERYVIGVLFEDCSALQRAVLDEMVERASLQRLR